jgi:GT2 family glycosyltransferase
MNKILTILLLRPNSPKCWIENANKIKNTLTYPQNDIQFFSEAASSLGGRYAKEANARNQAIDKLLKPEHTHVFWIDTDVVEYPPDIIEKLLALDSENCVSPYVFIEDNDWWNFKRFYDIDAFFDLDNKNFNYSPPYTDDDSLELKEVKSIGTCMLINAEVYRSGCMYDCFDPRVEHVSFFEQAKSKGYKVYACPKIEVRHAFLPKYGIQFR